MTTWAEQSRALRASVPSPDGLVRLGDELGEPVEAVRPLHGGVACAVHELRTPTRRLVLKRFGWTEAAALEFERLHLARHVPLPTPEPVALDVAGAWFGTEAFVVSYLPGGPMVPARPEVLGRLLAAIHTTTIPEPTPAVLHRPPRWQTFEPETDLPAGALDAIARLRVIAPDEPLVLAHCDFHPGNVLVDGDDVTGVVDWSNARLTTRGQDVGGTRCDLAIDPGGDAPDRFLVAYERAAGVTVDHLDLWDVLAAGRAIDEGDGWVDAWTEVGVPMSAELIRERATAFCTAALS